MWLTSEPNDILRALLGPPPQTPWAALIPQIILWSFRRFCVEHLLDAGTAALEEFIWTDMAEFIETYGPANLNTSDWLTPEHVDELGSSIEDYNRFCTDIIQHFDAALMDDNVPVQDAISDFLDGLHIAIEDWLSLDHPFMIFPGPFENPDEVGPKLAEQITKNMEDFYAGIPLKEEAIEAEVLPDIEPPSPAFFRRTLRANRAFTPSRMSGSTRHAVRPRPNPLG